MKQVTVTVHQDLRKMSNPNPWLNLLQITFPDGEQEFLVPNTENVVFDGQVYTPFGADMGTVMQDLNGGLHELEVTIQNITRQMSARVESKDLRGTEVRSIIINAARLADPTAVVEDLTYNVNEYRISHEKCIIRLGHDQLLKQRAPYGRILRDNCRWRYNMPRGISEECGAQDFVGPGTIASSLATVTGSDTDFLSRFIPGDQIIASSQTRTILSIASNTSLITTAAFSPGLGGVAYQVRKTTCSNTLEGPNGCRAHQNTERIGAFPGVPVFQG